MSKVEFQGWHFIFSTCIFPLLSISCLCTVMEAFISDNVHATNEKTHTIVM